MTDETQPPVRQPNTPRNLLRLLWDWSVKLVTHYPDRALIVFLILFGVAVIL